MGIEVRVLFFAGLRQQVGQREARWEVPLGTEVGGVRREAARLYPKAAGLVGRSAMAVNAEYVEDARVLQPGDEVAFIPPVSGGGGEGRVFRVTREPIAPGQLHDAVREDRHGAVVTFSGVVRGRSGDRRTRYLVYEAYEGMAERQMAEIGAEVRTRWDVAEISIVHRVGRLEVGEVSVLISVAGPHRAEAFEACRYAIDRVKECVPIWKKEVGEDGQAWVEGPERRGPAG